MINEISTLLVVLVVIIALFFALRQLLCWYWKINERIGLEEVNQGLLLKILEELENLNQTVKSEQKTGLSDKKEEDSRH